MVRFPKTEAEREEYSAHVGRAADRARAVLKPGDRIRVTRCGGASPTYTFDGWASWLTPEYAGRPPRWMQSKSGIDDLSPFCVLAVNGVPTSFRDDPKAHLSNPFDIPEQA